MEVLKQEAQKFLDEQFAIMSRHGNAPNLGDAQMEQLIAETQSTFNHLANPQEITHEEDHTVATT